MRAARRLLLASIPTVRPFHDLERRRSRPTYVALKTATFAHDGYSMTCTGVCFRPTVQDRAGPTLFNMPAVKCAFGAPVPGGCDDQVGRFQEFKVALQELLQVASSALDLKMGKVGLQPLGQRLRLCCGQLPRHPADAGRHLANSRHHNQPERSCLCPPAQACRRLARRPIRTRRQRRQNLAVVQCGDRDHARVPNWHQHAGLNFG